MVKEWKGRLLKALNKTHILTTNLKASLNEICIKDEFVLIRFSAFT